MLDIPLYCGKRKNILVISGGGMKFFSALGAVSKLIELEIIIKPDIFCGTSCGAILSFLLNINYSIDEIFYFYYHLNFETLLIDNIENIFNDNCFGFFLPDKGMYTVKFLMNKKNINSNINFKQLFELTGSKLIITGTCVNDESVHYFSVDTTPDMKVITALQISISIPFIFTPCRYDNKIWIDGGCINNYPIELFHDKLDDVIGIYLGNNKDVKEMIDSLDSYIFKIFKCIVKGLDYNKIKLYNKNTILIKSIDNISTKWNISKDEKKELFNIGMNSVDDFFSKI